MKILFSSLFFIIHPRNYFSSRGVQIIEITYVPKNCLLIFGYMQFHNQKYFFSEGEKEHIFPWFQRKRESKKAERSEVNYFLKSSVAFFALCPRTNL